MAFLTVNGTDYDLIAFSEVEPERAGMWGRAFDNGMYSQLRSLKRRWSGTTAFLTATQAASLRTGTSGDTPISVTIIPDSTTVSCMVRVNAIHDFTASGSGVLRYADLDIREV